MVEEFDLLEEVEVQFCDEECTESVWHGVEYSESLFCREKPKSELTVVIKEEGMMYFLAADMKEFAGLCRKHGWYIVSHQRFSEVMKIGMCLMEAGKHAGWYSLGRSKEWNAMMRDVLNFTFEREKNVVLLDDVLTTGESFRQLQRKMKQLGALSVIGVF